MIKFKIEYPNKVGDYSLNAIYGGIHWQKRRKHSEWWHWQVLTALKTQGIKRKLYANPVKIIMHWNDRLDIDNHAYMGKMIVDSLKGYLIKDDTRQYFVEVSHKFHNEGKYIIVEVSEI